LRDPAIPPPPEEKDIVGGTPVRDIFWFCPVLAVAYGLYRGKKRREWLRKHENP
jgi:hypothetical protein